MAHNFIWELMCPFVKKQWCCIHVLIVYISLCAVNCPFEYNISIISHFEFRLCFHVSCG